MVPRTFVLSGANGLCTPELKSLLETRLHAAESSILTSERVGFMYQVQTGLQYDKRAYRVPSWIKSLLDESKSIITDKASLYREMQSYGDFMASTRPLADVRTLKRDEILIVKPTGNRTYGGRGNVIVTSPEELRAVKRTYARSGAIASTYVNHPWLHHGRKMHLRLYFMVRAPTETHPYFYDLWSEGKIITAAEPYVPAAYANPKIHDTHMKSTDNDYSFPQDLEIPLGLDRETAIASIYAQLHQMADALGAIMHPHARPPPESYYGYEIFGLDVLITTVKNEPKIVLLEANTKVAYGPVGGQKEALLESGHEFNPLEGPWTPEYILFSRRYFEWMLEHVVLPFYDTPVLEKTYVISGNTGLEHAYLQYILEENGFNPSDTMASTGYLHLEKLCENLAAYDKVAQAMPCILKSILADTKREIADKERLHINLAHYFPEIAAKHLPQTWNVKHIPIKAKDTLLILRPVGPGASCGHGIQISASRREFDTAVKRINSEARRLKIKSIIASEYIVNPLLLNGYKFHLRMFLLVYVGANIPFGYHLWPRGRVVTARDPYTPGEWHNPAIHDTHGDSTPYNLWFPEDLPDVSYRYALFEQMKTIAAAAASILEQTGIRPYPESENAYEVFGCDFMIREDGTVILIEINDRVGYKNLGDRETFDLTPLTEQYYSDGRYTYDDFSYDYFSWLFERVIGPVFMPNTAPRGLRQSTFGLDPPPDATFDTETSREFFGGIILQIKDTFNPDLTLEDLIEVAPVSMRSDLLVRYDTVDAGVWSQITREIAVALLQTSKLYTADKVNISAIEAGYNQLYTLNVTYRPDILSARGDEVIAEMPAPMGAIKIMYGTSHPDILETILKLRFDVWRPVKSNKRTVEDWADATDSASLHLYLQEGNEIIAATRLALYPTWDAFTDGRWFNRLTEQIEGPVGIIGRLVVSSAYQGQGLGKYLDLMCIEIASRMQCRTIFCDVPPYRVEALKRMGFRQIMEPKYSRNFPDLPWVAMVYTL